MTIRTRLNESKLGKYINSTKLGKWFEQTDFAISTEINIRLTKELALSNDPINKSLSIASVLFSPLLIPLGYALAKYYKKHEPERYNLAKIEYCPQEYQRAIDNFSQECINEFSLKPEKR